MSKHWASTFQVLPNLSYCPHQYTYTTAPPSFPSLAIWKSGRGPGTFSHMSDITGRKPVERLYHSPADIKSLLETATRTFTLRYILRSCESYSEELVTEPPLTQDGSINTVQETLNSQFRLFFSVTPCMPCTSRLESFNHSPSPYCLAPHPPKPSPCPYS